MIAASIPDQPNAEMPTKRKAIGIDRMQNANKENADNMLVDRISPGRANKSLFIVLCFISYFVDVSPEFFRGKT